MRLCNRVMRPQSEGTRLSLTAARHVLVRPPEVDPGVSVEARSAEIEGALQYPPPSVFASRDRSWATGMSYTELGGLVLGTGLVAASICVLLHRIVRHDRFRRYHEVGHAVFLQLGVIFCRAGFRFQQRLVRLQHGFAGDWLLQWIDSRADGTPAIVCGDFNATLDASSAGLMATRFRPTQTMPTVFTPLADRNGAV